MAKKQPKARKNSKGKDIKALIKKEFPVGQLLKAESRMYYAQTAKKVAPLLDGNRLQSIKNIDILKKYLSVAKAFVKELYVNKLTEESRKNNPKGFIPAIDLIPHVSKHVLTKSGKIGETYAFATLKGLENSFNVEDSFPHFIGNSTIRKLIKTEKQIVAQMHINGVGKHNRPCYIIRSLLSCEIYDNVYLFVADEKYYQNSPTVSFSLSLLYNGKHFSPCLLSRIDSVGHLGTKAGEELGIEAPPLTLPSYLLYKFTGHHDNAYSPKESHETNKVSATHHIHERNDDFEAMYALSCLAYSTIFRTRPTDFLKFNAMEFSDLDIYSQKVKGKINEKDFKDRFKLIKEINELKKHDILENQSVIDTGLLQDYFVDVYNITNYEKNEESNKIINEFRIFKPDRVGTVINTRKFNTRSDILTINPSASCTLEKNAQNVKDKIIDHEYIPIYIPVDKSSIKLEDIDEAEIELDYSFEEEHLSDIRNQRFVINQEFDIVDEQKIYYVQQNLDGNNGQELSIIEQENNSTQEYENISTQKQENINVSKTLSQNAINPATLQKDDEHTMFKH